MSGAAPASAASRVNTRPDRRRSRATCAGVCGRRCIRDRGQSGADAGSDGGSADRRLPRLGQRGGGRSRPPHAPQMRPARWAQGRQRHLALSAAGGGGLRRLPRPRLPCQRVRVVPAEAPTPSVIMSAQANTLLAARLRGCARRQPARWSARRAPRRPPPARSLQSRSNSLRHALDVGRDGSGAQSLPAPEKPWLTMHPSAARGARRTRAPRAAPRAHRCPC